MIDWEDLVGDPKGFVFFMVVVIAAIVFAVVLL